MKRHGDRHMRTNKQVVAPPPPFHRSYAGCSISGSADCKSVGIGASSSDLQLTGEPFLSSVWLMFEGSRGQVGTYGTFYQRPLMHTVHPISNLLLSVDSSQATMHFNFLKCVLVMDAFLKRLIIYLLTNRKLSPSGRDRDSGRGCRDRHKGCGKGTSDN